MTQHRQDPPATGADGERLAPPARLTVAGLHPIAPGPNAAADALAILHAWAAAERRDVAPALAIVVEELLLNLVEHGGARTIGFGLARTPAGVRLTLVDDGAAFDPRAAASPGDHPPERGGGAGLALVRAWSRDLAYASGGGRNRLDLLVPFDGG